LFGRRLKIVYAVLCGALLLLCAKAFLLQVMQWHLEDPAAVLHPPKPWQTMPAARGAILDRNGRILAADRPHLDLAILYSRLSSDEWIEPMREATGLSAEELIRKRRAIMERVQAIRNAVLSHPRNRRIREKILAGKMSKWRIYEETIPHTIVANISLETAARVEANPQRFADMVIRTQLQRECPGSGAFRHVTGYLGRAQRDELLVENETVSPGDRLGRAGIEKQYDHLLRGVPGLFLQRTIVTGRFDARADPLLAGVTAAARKRIDRRVERERQIPLQAKHGRSLFLTLDGDAQQRAAEALRGKKGAVVVMDVENGELLVLATAPAEDHLNRAIQDPIPCGSVIKPLVALAAGEVGLNTSVNCTGSIRIAGRAYHCSHSHAATDLRKGIARSCNIYFWRLGRRIGVAPIVEMARDLGFGKRTGVDLPYEWRGRLPTPRSPMNLCIGQGNLQVTPLQVAVAMAAVANGGKVLRPRILLRVEPEPPSDEMPDTAPVVLRKVDFSPQVLEVVRAGMEAAVAEPAGTVYDIRRLRTLKVAAKTGTAETGDSRNHAWLAGYVPWDRPRYAFAAVVHRTEGYGAQVAGPIVAEVLDALMNAH